MTGTVLPGKVAFGCVAEATPHFSNQVLRLLRSIRWFGGSLADADVFVCVVGEVDPARCMDFEALGAQVREVSEFNPLNRFCNKVRFLELPELERYETIVLLDCDMALVQDPAPYFAQPALQLKIADLPTVSNAVLARLCAHFGLSAPAPIYRTTCSEEPTIWYCNTGVMILPAAWISDILPAWREYILRLCAEPGLFGPPYNHCNQAAMSLVYLSNPVPFSELPAAMNFPLHQTHRLPAPALLHEDPVILHYHDRVDSEGLLLPVPYPLAQKRVQQLNERLVAAALTPRPPLPRRGEGETPLPFPTTEAPRGVVCITGMHRSGTSLVGQILHHCGPYLGPYDLLAKPTPDNLDGYWEHPDFRRLNDDILSHFGGGWDVAPTMPDGWEKLPELEPLRQRAHTLIRQFDDQRFWGWKDPRSALTMPFWRHLIPGLKVVICVRNPLEVARSLSQRGMSSLAFGLRLWHMYYERLLAAMAPQDRIITHYDAYFADAAAETSRILAWLDIPASPDSIQRVCGAATDELRHHRSSMADLLAIEAPAAVLQLYGQLCDEVGAPAGAALAKIAPKSVATDDYTPAAPGTSLAAALALLQAHEAELAALRPAVSTSQTELAILRPVLEARETEVAFLTPALAAREAEIAGYTRELETTRAIVLAREAEIAGYTRELETTHAIVLARETEIAGYARELEATRALIQARESEIAAYGRELEATRALVQARETEIAGYAQLYGLPRPQLHLPHMSSEARMHWEEIAGWFQWRSAQEEAAAWFPEGSCFVEVGTYIGRSLCSLGDVVKRSGKTFTVIGIDTCRGSGPEGYRQRDYHGAIVAQNGGTFAGVLHKNVIDCGYGDAIWLIIAPSVAASQLFGDTSLDWVHLDARHDYANVTADIRAWLPKVKRGGWLSGDDYDEDKWPEVVRAVGDVLPGAKPWSTQQWRWIVE